MEIKISFDNPATFYNFRTYHIETWIEGRVTLVDSIGQRKSWWIPIEPTNEFKEPQYAYIPSDPDYNIMLSGQMYHWIRWSHYSDCEDCPDC